MSIFVVVLLSILYAGDSSLPSKTTLETSRVKRDIWMDNDYYADDYYRAEGSKYSWMCRECSIGSQVLDTKIPGSIATDLCEVEAKWNQEPYPFQNCTVQQECEKFSKTDADESIYDIWTRTKFEEEGYNLLGGDTPGRRSANVLYRGCCEKFGECDFKLGFSGLEQCRYFAEYGLYNEYIHRTCCVRGGLFCDSPVQEPTEERIQQCNQSDRCKDIDGLLCCNDSNVTCTIPECGENDACLTGFEGRNCLRLGEFGACCEYYNKCGGSVC